MANVAVAVVAGAAGAIAGKVMSNGKGGRGGDEDVDFAPDGRANANHEVEAKSRGISRRSTRKWTRETRKRRITG